MNSAEYLEAKIFHSFTTAGYSRPGRVTCSRLNGSEVDTYVKFFGAIRNREFGLVAELVCSQLAIELQLPVPNPFVVRLPDGFVNAVPESARDLVHRSRGLNFGSEAAPVGFSVVPPAPLVPIALRTLAAEIFAFDVIVQNYDRKSDNPNLLWNRERIAMIDHESALSPVLKTSTTSAASLELDRFYDHVFWDALSPAQAGLDRLRASMGKLSSTRIDAILGRVPKEWQSSGDLQRVRDHLVWIIENHIQVCDLITERLS